MNRQVVEVGQRFEQLGHWRRLWEVEAIGRSGKHVRHVTLRDVTDPLDRRTLAPAVLFDPWRYRRVDPLEPQPSAAPSRRRSGLRGRHLGRQAAPADLPASSRSPQGSMVIESRSADGYVISCNGLYKEHRFRIAQPGPSVDCPICGSRRRAVDLLGDAAGVPEQPEDAVAQAPEGAGRVLHIGSRSLVGSGS